MLFVVGLIAAYTLKGCITAQQLRERRIDKNHELFNAFNPDIQEKVRFGQIPWFQSRYGQTGMGQS